MENGGLDRETHQECHWTVYDSHHAWQRSKKFTVKHYCEMDEHNIFYFKVEYIVLFGIAISQKCLTVNLLLCHA